MRAGSLNKRATFQALVSTPDGSGGSVQAWVDYTAVWVSMTPDRAREKIQQGRIADNQSGVLRIRSSTTTRAIDDTYRVVLGGVIYNVRSYTNPDQRNDILEFIIETDGSQFVALGPISVELRSAISAAVNLAADLRQTNLLGSSISGVVFFAGDLGLVAVHLGAAITGSITVAGDILQANALRASISVDAAFSGDIFSTESDWDYTAEYLTSF